MTQTVVREKAAPTYAATTLIPPSGAGLRVPRRHTRPGVDPLDEVVWDRRRTVIANPDGSDSQFRTHSWSSRTPSAGVR